MFLKNRTLFIFLKMAANMFFQFKVRGAGAAFEIYCGSQSRIISGRLRFPAHEGLLHKILGELEQGPCRLIIANYSGLITRMILPS